MDLPQCDQSGQIQNSEMHGTPDLDDPGIGQLVSNSADRLDGGPQKIGDIPSWQLHGQNPGAIGQWLIGHDLGGQCEQGGKPFLWSQCAK